MQPATHAVTHKLEPKSPVRREEFGRGYNWFQHVSFCFRFLILGMIIFSIGMAPVDADATSAPLTGTSFGVVVGVNTDLHPPGPNAISRASMTSAPPRAIYTGGQFTPPSFLGLRTAAGSSAFRAYLSVPWGPVGVDPVGGEEISQSFSIYLAGDYTPPPAAGLGSETSGPPICMYLSYPWLPRTTDRTAPVISAPCVVYLGQGFVTRTSDRMLGEAGSNDFAAYLGREFQPPDQKSGGGQVASEPFGIYLSASFMPVVYDRVAAEGGASAGPVYLGGRFGPPAGMGGSFEVSTPIAFYLGQGFAAPNPTGFGFTAGAEPFCLFLGSEFRPPLHASGAFAISAAFSIYLWRQLFGFALSPHFLIDLRNVSGVIQAGLSPLALRQPWPNPFSTTATIQFDLPQTSQVRLCVFDAQGRLLRSLADQEMKAGGYSVGWDGRDELGRECPSGLYFVRLVTRLGSLSQKTFRIR